MNIHNISRSMDDGALTITYTSGAIEKTVLSSLSKRIQFYFKDQTVVSVEISESLVLDAVYLKQFGISVTEDGTYFFIQSWSMGLFCFEIKTGKLVWRYKRKQACDLVVRWPVVICRFLDQCVDAIEIASGHCIAHYPLGIQTKFLPLDDDFYLVGPKRSHYFILDHNLNSILRIHEKQMNPESFDTFIINSARFSEDGITINGFEYARDVHTYAIHAGCVEEYTQKSRFERHVKLDPHIFTSKR